MKDKIVILVTHQLQFLKECDKILVIEDNKQKALGNYKTITETGLDIEEILKSFNKNLKEEGKGEKKQYDDEKKKKEKTGETKDVMDKKAGTGNLMVNEEKELGSLGWQDVKNLMSFSYGYWGIFIYIFASSSAAGCQLYTTFWVSYWSE